MITRKQRQFYKSLERKKYRDQTSLFVVEGEKSIAEFLSAGFKCQALYVTDKALFKQQVERVIITEKQAQEISLLSQAPAALAIFQQPCLEPAPQNVQNELVVALDAVRDPGNLGTIIRLCDWFGIKHLVCSQDTVDCYNSKVVQATMGSLTRVQVHYLDLKHYLNQVEGTVFGALLEGKSIYQTELKQSGVLLLGNESRGISTELLPLIQSGITIPQLKEKPQTESLNVAMASAILIHEFCRPAKT